MKFLFAACVSLMAICVSAQEIGSVPTVWHGASIDVLAFDDPKVEGSTCFLSRAKQGGIAGALGIATETSDASIACRAVGPLKFVGKIINGEQVFNESRSILFKKLRVVRFWDDKRQVLVYLAYSDKLIDGSPKNSISVVPFR